MSDYASINDIPTILKNNFETIEIVIRYNEIHFICKIKIGELLDNPNIRNWEKNRPPDMIRCKEIAQFIYTKQKDMDTMLYVSYNNRDNKYDILDGIHRYTALKIIKEHNSKPLDLICHNDFGSGNNANWLYDQYILVNIYFNLDQGEKMSIFENLNKCQPVPELYSKNNDQSKREIIETVANEWIRKYKKHFSSSTNPILGHTNRDKFISLLDTVYEKYKVDDADYLKSLLSEANAKLSLNIPLEATVAMRLKSKETGCFLFLMKNDYLENFI
jgi:hypothetical protein